MRGREIDTPQLQFFFPTDFYISASIRWLLSIVVLSRDVKKTILFHANVRAVPRLKKSSSWTVRSVLFVATAVNFLLAIMMLSLAPEMTANRSGCQVVCCCCNSKGLTNIQHQHKIIHFPKLINVDCNGEITIWCREYILSPGHHFYLLKSIAR